MEFRTYIHSFYPLVLFLYYGTQQHSTAPWGAWAGADAELAGAELAGAELVGAELAGGDPILADDVPVKRGMERGNPATVEAKHKNFR